MIIIARFNGISTRELLCFMRNQGGGPRQEANQALKDSNAQLLTQNYPKLSSEQQQKLAQMPQNWAMLRVAWVKGSESDRQKMGAEFQQPAVQPGPQADPRRDAASEAYARYEAFLKKEARTVSEQELLRTATDCDTVARELRREGGEQNLAWAATWDQAARNLRAGKEAYLKQIAAQAANSEMLQIMQAQNRARAQQNNAQALRNISTMNYVTRMNIASNLGNSGYHYEVRSSKTRVPTRNQNTGRTPSRLRSASSETARGGRFGCSSRSRRRRGWRDGIGNRLFFRRQNR